MLVEGARLISRTLPGTRLVVSAMGPCTLESEYPLGMFKNLQWQPAKSKTFHLLIFRNVP